MGTYLRKHKVSRELELSPRRALFAVKPRLIGCTEIDDVYINKPCYLGPADKTAAGQTHLYPEIHWQAKTAGYSNPDRSHCSTRHANGYGADTTRGRWIIEGDRASYFDTVHHRLLLKCVRRRVQDRRFVDLFYRFLKAGHIDRGLFTASSERVPQGGVLSPLLSNIMLHEFDMWLEANYLNKKARKDRWAWNFGIQQGRRITVRENRQWKPAVAYCRYVDDFVLIVKGTRAQAGEIHEECRVFLEGELKLTAEHGEDPCHTR